MTSDRLKRIVDFKVYIVWDGSPFPVTVCWQSTPGLYEFHWGIPIKFKWAWLFRAYRGWNTTQLYGDYFINHYKDPSQTTRISTQKVSGTRVLFVARCSQPCSHASKKRLAAMPRRSSFPLAPVSRFEGCKGYFKCSAHFDPVIWGV